MDSLSNFKAFLIESGASAHTAKNYTADLRYFLNWFRSAYGQEFYPERLDTSVIQSYKIQNSALAERTLKRHLSSLRKFTSYLIQGNKLSINPFENAEHARDKEDWDIKGVKDFLYIQNVSPSSSKNYIADIKQFLSWTAKVAPRGTEGLPIDDIYSKLSPNLIEEYKSRLTSQNFSPLSINRKLSSIRKLVSWAHESGRIESNFLKTEPEFPFSARGQTGIKANQDEEILDNIFDDQKTKTYSSFPPLRLTQKIKDGLIGTIDYVIIDRIIQIGSNFNHPFVKSEKDMIFGSDIEKISVIQDPLKISNISKSFYDPLNVSTKSMSSWQKIIHIVRFNRPKWYLKYHKYPAVHYAHFAILIVFMSTLGFGIYQGVWGQDNSGVLGASIFASSRTITIKQRLSDSNGIPISAPSSVRFAIYDDAQAKIGNQLWEETIQIDPDDKGEFTATIGQRAQIPAEIFISYPSLWLGMSVGQGSELRPRQQLAQVASAANAEALQGMAIMDEQNQTNSILALDSTGNLSLRGSAPHAFQSLDSQLILSGNLLTLNTIPGSNSNIEISPDGSGIIDIQGPIQNTSNNNNYLSALGSVEFDDNVSIFATSSSQSAFIIDQNGTGPLISASTQGIARLSLDNFGALSIAGDFSLSGDNPKISATTPNANLTLGSSGTGILTLQPTARGDIEFFSSLNTISATGNLKITGNITLSSPSATTTFGGLTYKWPTSGQSDGYILKTNGSGTLSWTAIPDLTTLWNQTSRNVGIGTTQPNFRLDIQDSQAATAAAQVFNTNTANTASGLTVKLGNTLSTTDVNNKWITFEQAGIGIVGMIKGNGTNGITFQGNGVADFAEYLKKDENEYIPFGSVVCLNTQGLVESCRQDQDKIIGITSENPTFLGGENLGNRSVPVGLTGQVLTQVSNIRGGIKPGDPLTTSSIPGVAVKADKAGRIVGRAVEKFDSLDCPFDTSSNFGLIDDDYNNLCKGKIYVILNVSHYEPSLADQTAKFAKTTLSQTTEGYYILRDEFGKIIEDTGVFGNLLAGNITAGLVDAQKIIVDSLDVNGSVRIAGEDIADYIARVISNQPQITSPVGDFDELRARIISPISSQDDIAIKLPDESSLNIQNENEEIVASINSSGDATFSGTLVAQTLQGQNINSENASVSGTLRAGKIIADQIEGFNTNNNNSNSEFIDIASMSSQFANVGNLRALTGNFIEGLIAQRPSTFSDISVFGQLKVDGNLVLASNSMNTLGIDLEIQSLRQGNISLMGGLIYIDIDGNIKVDGNATFAKNVSIGGKLSVNIVSPIPDQDFTIDIGDGSSFVVKNGSQSALLSLNNSGDLSATGSASFGKINLSLVKPALAISPTVSSATGSAGIATISAYQRELTIRNPLVTDKSLIYITPKVDTNNQVLYLLRQVPGVSFTIGINTILNKQIPFNWIIIN